ncbi:hypothetical protein J5277_12085 [Rhizobium sp. 16-449-1b]|uniref:hypothetical protein n=1 Tax=Rhizobium sp. 16-449-1b TaxID=2819989 RepID=UPI001ADA3AD5|nr:hypothetical protein [Rhizobium sp. 16-449-1b]MBO9194847.1 hypothetical protein [Rhizobium sp. 16-449-1b]
MRNSNKATAAAATSSIYDTLEIDASARARLESMASFIADLGRRSTEQTFELGDHLHSASEMLAEGAFDTWVKKRCGLNARSARNYRAVFRNLSDYRDTLVDLSIGTTVLFHLSSAKPEQIEEAIAFAQEQGRLQVADVKAILSDEADVGSRPEADPYAVGGIDGLKALIAVKGRDGVKSYTAHVDAIRQAIEASLAGKRVIKETLAREIQDLARVTLQELYSLALFVEPKIEMGYNPRATTFAKGSYWDQVNRLLYKLGGVDYWPKSGEMRDWLANTVLPTLEWAVSKQKNPAWLVGRADTAADVVAGPDEVAATPGTAIAETSDEPADTSISAAVKRMDDELNAATGGLIRVMEEPVARMQVADVPPLDADGPAAQQRGFKRPAILDSVKARKAERDAASAPASVR